MLLLVETWYASLGRKKFLKHYNQVVPLTNQNYVHQRKLLLLLLQNKNDKY